MEKSLDMYVFGRLLSYCSQETANKLCTSFPEIAFPDKLCITSDASDDYVIKVFCEDSQEIVYKTNAVGQVEGIVTFGAFLEKYGAGKSWINTNFCFVSVENINEEKIKTIFMQKEKIIRIPVLDTNKKICFEVRKSLGGSAREDRRKQLIPFAKLRNHNIPCFLVRRPEFLKGYVYTSKEQYRIENHLSFTKMKADIDKYEAELKDVIGSKYSRTYVEKLSQIPAAVKEGRRIRHVDSRTEMINVIGGERITVGVPEKEDRQLHVYGRCGVFGYAVEDYQTIPSQLQKLCNQNRQAIRVVNHGTWGTDAFLHNLLQDIDEGVIRNNDIVLVYAMIEAWWEKKTLEKMSVHCWDTTDEFHEFLKKGNTFYDTPGHMTAEGYAFIAASIYTKMKDMLVFQEFVCEKREFVGSSTCVSDEIKEIENYLCKIKKILPLNELSRAKTGAIIMNCNPFTLGHRYLIEMAKKRVDYLVIFVVEEDKSFFPFADRIAMVRQGTRDISNVYVVPSGNYILSSLTFPGYFLKEQNPDIKVDVTEDVKIFGKYIAPALHITARFAGTEPLDKVTAQYHVYLKRFLKDFGVEFHEIPRQMIGEEYISASIVRKLLREKAYEKLACYVPETTFKYLQNNNMILT